MLFKGANLTIDRIKKMTYEELSEVCFAIRNEIIRITSLNGGHLSSNLGVVELIVALCKHFDFPNDKLLIDVGHQSYTYKILTGRNMDTLRKKGGVSGFQKREESVYDIFEAGHSSTSLSHALGMAIARDLKKEKYEIIALIGDASILNGMALEALNDIGSRKTKVIILLNDNDMSVTKTIGSLHNNNNAREIYKDFGLDYIGPINGHNIDEIEKAFSKAKQSKKSVLIHCYTEKGKGYSFAEDDTLGIYHGISPFKVSTGTPIQGHKNQKSFSSFFGDLVFEALENDRRRTIICPAMTLGTGMNQAFFRFPSRCFDVGIAEEHAVSLASGMALNDLHPIVSIYSTFLQRAFDQVSHDVCRMNLPVLFLIDRSGLVGEDGETHQGLYDEGFLLNTPNMVVTCPSNMSTSKALFNIGLNYNGPFAIRYPRGYYCKDDILTDIKIEFGSWQKIIDLNDDVVVISMGHYIERLNKLFIRNKTKVTLYNALFLNHIKEDILKSLLNYKVIVIVNSMATIHGFNNNITSYLLENNYTGKVHSFAISDEFVKQATIEEQLIENQIEPERIVNFVKDIVDNL